MLGNDYCKFAEACKFKHEGPKGGGGGGKRNSSTLVSAKGAPKKKQKGTPEKEGQRTATMVVKDLKAILDKGGDHAHGRVMRRTHTRFATPGKKRNPPYSSSSEEEAYGMPKEKGQTKKKQSTRPNK
jgi:hypothetical protein